MIRKLNGDVKRGKNISNMHNSDNCKCHQKHQNHALFQGSQEKEKGKDSKITLILPSYLLNANSQQFCFLPEKQMYTGEHFKICS